MKQRILHILSILVLLLVGSQTAAWSQTAEISGSNWNNISSNTISWEGNHATFTISGGKISYGSTLGGYIDISKNTNYTLKWSVDPSCTINVTNIHVKAGSSSLSCTFYLGNKSVECRWSNKELDNTPTTNGNNGSIIMKASNGCRIYSVKVTYTITPNAPSLAAASKTLTVDETIDVADCFGVPSDHFTKAYGCSEGGKLEGSVFSADKAGTYTVYSYIAASSGCHAESAHSQNLQITVNRIPGSITATDATAFVNDPTDLSAWITASLGTGKITYQVVSDNRADADIQDGSFVAHKAGVYTVKAVKAQDDKYNEAETTFNVTVSRKDQTLSFVAPDDAYEKNIVRGTTAEGAARAEASSHLPVTYSSSNGAISVDENGNVTAVALSNDDIIVTVTQTGNDEFNPASIERTFRVIQKKEVNIEEDGLTGANSTLRVDETATLTLTDEGEGFTYASSQPDVVSLTKTGNVITLTACKKGTSIVTLSQPETTTHSATTRTYQITVEKVENTLQVSPASTQAVVDEQIAVTLENRNNTESPLVAEITDQTLLSAIRSKDDVITYADGVLTAVNAGTAKITFKQAETNKYEAFTSATYEITVSKIGNPIRITLNGEERISRNVAYGENVELGYSSPSDAPYEVERIAGEDAIATLSGNTLTAGETDGSCVWRIRQAETYKYLAGEATFRIKVNSTKEEEGYVYTGWCDGTEKDWSTIGGTGALKLNGPGEFVTFQAKATSIMGVWSTDNFYARYSTDGGSSWVTGLQINQLKSKDKWYDLSFSVPENATHIQFLTETGAVGNKQIRNVRVSRKTYVRAKAERTELGEVLTGESTSVTLDVDYSSTNGGNIEVVSNNPHFQVAPAGITVSPHSDNVGKPAKVTVTYTPDAAQLGEEEATISIGDLFYSQDIHLTATAAKRANALEVIANQQVKVDDVIENVVTNRNSSAPLQVSASKQGVAEYDATNNCIRALGAGAVTLTFTQEADEQYEGATKQVTITVTKYDQTLEWDNALSQEELTLNVGETLTQNTATASSGLKVTYASANSSVLDVNPETGEIRALTGGANIAVTATQEGNYKYNTVSLTRYFNVISRMDAEVLTTLSSEEENTLYVDEDVTLSCVASLTEANFTLTGNEEGFIQTSFANNTLTLTPVKAGGEITLHLTRPEDENYNAIDLTFILMVKQPRLSLVPSQEPDFRNTDYSAVTLQRTLRAGFNSIALPFPTSVQELTGRDDAEDWVAQLAAVTYNAEDGYSLYFRKVENGTMEANEPYILHLADEVANPTLTNKTLDASGPVRHSVKASNGAVWFFTANYTPQLPMEGRYGVVNAGGALHPGAASSFLNVYTAFLQGPQAASARSLFLEFDEENTLAGLTPNAKGTEVYDLLGRKSSRTNAKGLRILHSTDGTTRKVIF